MKANVIHKSQRTDPM